MITFFVVAGDYTSETAGRQESIFNRNGKGPRRYPRLHLHAAPGWSKLLPTSHLNDRFLTICYFTINFKRLWGHESCSVAILPLTCQFSNHRNRQRASRSSHATRRRCILKEKNSGNTRSNHPDNYSRHRKTDNFQTWRKGSYQPNERWQSTCQLN